MLQLGMLAVIALCLITGGVWLIGGHTSRLVELAGLILLAASVVMAIPTINAYSLAWHRRLVEGREVDEHYRRLCHSEFFRSFDLEIAGRQDAADSEFIQRCVRGIQQTLSQVGVPNAQVCILQIGDRGAYVSYYAGYEPPEISKGAVIADFSAVGSRRVVYRASCPLGLEDDSHQLAVVATCSKLPEANRKFLNDAISGITSACKKGTLPESLLP